ncbi:MAG: hypothetical protein JSW71_09170 [Gemmatimonadota bacterium]|nr:MAG: hypothetical protein JSW71_09170 [Gemmatimonadota bacterium]
MVKCPRCGMLVQPDNLPAPQGSPDSSGGDEKRWSFLWVAPRGDVCPECEFPLSKYFGRLKWIRTTMVGLVIVALALVLQIGGVIASAEPPYIHTMQAAIIVGAAITAVGIIGVLIGGRHRTIHAPGKR